MNKVQLARVLANKCIDCATKVEDSKKYKNHKNRCTECFIFEKQTSKNRQAVHRLKTLKSL